MLKQNKKIIIGIVAIIFSIATIFICNNNNINNTIKTTENILDNIENNVIITEEIQEIVNNTISTTQNGEDVSTTKIIESSETEEQNITDEGATETDAVIDQENISYNGDNTGNGLSLLGAYQGLTYYSQADSRWANVMYSSIGDSSQTMKSSACRTNFCSNSCKFF